MHQGEESQCKHGKPQQEVDFLIQHIDRHDTQSIVILDGAGGTKTVERALGHGRKD